MSLGLWSWCFLSMNQFLFMKSYPFFKTWPSLIFLQEIFLNFSFFFFFLESLWFLRPLSTCWLYLKISKLSVPVSIAVWVYIFPPLWDEELWTGARNLWNPPATPPPTPGIVSCTGEALRKCFLAQISRSLKGSFLKGISIAKGISFYPNKPSPKRSDGINFIFSVIRTSSCLPGGYDDGMWFKDLVLHIPYPLSNHSCNISPLSLSGVYVFYSS